MALNSLFCADVPLSNYSLTHMGVSTALLYLSICILHNFHTWIMSDHVYD